MFVNRTQKHEGYAMGSKTVKTTPGSTLRDISTRMDQQWSCLYASQLLFTLPLCFILHNPLPLL